MSTPAPDPRRWLMLPVILTASFMAGFDVNIVNVAVPSLQKHLGAGPVALELVVGGYAFAYATGLVTGGRLGDLYGYRRMFILGMAGFTVASVLCGVSNTPSELVGARLLQGLTASAMVPQVLALLTRVFPAEERPKAMSWLGVVAGLCGIAGQVLGGVLLSADVFGLGWRVIFYLNAPIGVVTILLAARLLPDGRSEARPRLDPLGVAGVSGSLALALVPLVLGQQEHWPVWTWVMLAASVPLFAATIAWERRIARGGGQPLLDLTLFKIRSFNLGLAMNAMFMFCFASFMFVLSLMLQSGIGLSPMRAGLSFGPMAVLAMAASLLGRPFAVRYGLRVMIVGALVNCASILALAVEIQVRHSSIDTLGAVIPLSLTGLGGGLILPVLFGAPMAGVDRSQAGVAAGTLNTTQQFSGATGIAVLGALFFSGLRLTGPVVKDYAHAAGPVFWIDAVLYVVMIGFALALLRRRPAPAPAPAAAVPAPAPAPADQPMVGEATV